jgi:hypothetical protein
MLQRQIEQLHAFLWLGSWQSADQRFFAIRKISISRLIGQYRLTDFARFRACWAQTFLPNFFVENGKIFVGKSGQAGKNFRGSKIFDGVNFGANQKRAMPWSSMQWPF